MGTILCPKCESENVKPIEMWEISESGVIKVPKSMWVCERPMCMHKWSRCRDPIETTAVMSRYLNILRS